MKLTPLSLSIPGQAQLPGQAADQAGQDEAPQAAVQDPEGGEGVPLQRLPVQHGCGRELAIEPGRTELGGRRLARVEVFSLLTSVLPLFSFHHPNTRRLTVRRRASSATMTMYMAVEYFIKVK